MVMPFDPTASVPLCLVSVSSTEMNEKELYEDGKVSVHATRDFGHSRHCGVLLDRGDAGSRVLRARPQGFCENGRR